MQRAYVRREEMRRRLNTALRRRGPRQTYSELIETNMPIRDIEGKIGWAQAIINPEVAKPANARDEGLIEALRAYVGLLENANKRAARIR